MCGIAGLVRLDGSAVDPQQLELLTSCLAHRGPDGRGMFNDSNAGISQTRLSIIDLSERSAQPLFSADKDYVLVFNGEMYNFQEERKILQERGHHFKSSGDGEVLLHMYIEYGITTCLERARGMFAFALWDRPSKKLYIARDRVGKKPLKYFINNGTLAFASELKALKRLPDCPKDIDVSAIHDYLTMMYLPAPRTGYTGIHKLPAGHLMTVDLANGTHKMEQYWKLTYNTDLTLSEDEWAERSMELLTESVKLRMIADVPVGAFLSGGIDSAAIVGLMSKISSHPVKTFSIGSEDPAFNELPYAAITAKHFGTDHHPIVLEPDIVHLLPELVRTYEEPYADPSAIPTYLIARETRKVVTVALNGDGGDENFAGYARYPILNFSEYWNITPWVLHIFARLMTESWQGMFPSTLSYRSNRFQRTMGLPWEQRYLQYISFFTEEEKKQLYSMKYQEKFGRTDLWYAKHTEAARGRAYDLVHRAMSMDVQTYLADCLMPKVDLGAMAHGLEARSPFLDHKLLEFTAQMPIEYKLRGNKKKWILRERMLKGLVPDNVLHKKKTGFRLPLNRWFRTDLKDFVADHLLQGPPLFREIFDRGALERFLAHYHATNIDYSDHIWALLTLSEWIKQQDA